MFETIEQREAREKAEAAARQERMLRYNERQYPPVTLQPKKPKHVTQPVKPLRNKSNVTKSRASYMREYRQKQKAKLRLCPHCGKEI